MKSELDIARLKKAREGKGITMAEAARRLNLSKIGYCRYEYGERTPSTQTLEAIARCFGTSVAYLTGESEDISPDIIIIEKEKDPELFLLVQRISADKDAASRILEYYKKHILEKIKK
ncbi:MAG: helix-turn-helix transcriptional regulator [Clostridiales bacterium]|nr:helix-turn-helix transcriptional regulator [Clostridiales bacterium]